MRQARVILSSVFPMKSSDSTASPLKSAAEEIAALRRILAAVLTAYGSSIDSALVEIAEFVGKEAGKKRISTARIHDGRDITTLIRTLKIKPEKARRRDLKKIESVVDDLKQIVGTWRE